MRRLLVLGGTWFLGRELVECALAQSVRVTTFNRGRTGKDVPGVEVVRGDRSSPADLKRLAERGPWDAVIDTSGMIPWEVLVSAEILAPVTTRYVLISTVNVYEGWPTQPLVEGCPVRECAPDAVEAHDERWGDRYARLKAGCERALESVFGQTALILRPGVIVGPYEYIGRLPWWLRRLERGGRVLAPGLPDRPIQPIDSRDVAAFALTAAQAGRSGTFNLTAPIGHSTYGELLDSCREVTGSESDLVWVDDDFLLARDIQMWTELPLWRTFPGTWQIDSDRAHSMGLTCRPLAETVAATWSWMASDGITIESHRSAEIGIDPAKEASLLAEWSTRSACR